MCLCLPARFETDNLFGQRGEPHSGTQTRRPLPQSERVPVSVLDPLLRRSKQRQGLSPRGPRTITGHFPNM